MKEITAAEFETEVIESEQQVLVKLTAGWCGPCRAMQPVLEAFAEEVKDTLKIVELDIDGDGAHEICKEFAVRSVPKLILFRNGVEVRSHTGTANKDTLLKLIAD